MNLVIQSFLTSGLLLIFLLTATFSSAVTKEETQDEVTAANTEIRLIQYSFTLKNMSDALLPLAELWCHVPLQKTQFYNLYNLQVSEEFKYHHDLAGNPSLYIQLNNLPPFSSKIITILATLELFKNPQPVIEKDLSPYLAPEPFIESDNPEIIKLAEKLHQIDMLKNAEAIFNWVATNLHYTGYLKNIRGALYSFKQKQGDCTEFAALFTALCRASGIPARLMGGYVSSANSTLHSRDYHNWAEFYLNGTWQIADPQRGVFMPGQDKYIAMQVIKTSNTNAGTASFNRFKFEGEGLKVRMN